MNLRTTADCIIAVARYRIASKSYRHRLFSSYEAS